MKRVITAAFVFLSICFVFIALTPSMDAIGRSDGAKLETTGQPDAVDAVADTAQQNNFDPFAFGFNQSIENSIMVMTFPDLYVQAMGNKCVTPYTVCDTETQPINYPCCCPDGSCGYVSQ
jgi:hypothetical protein